MKIGIIGCGKIAKVHATILKNILNKPSLVFCDRNRNKADNLAERYFPGRTYTTIEELLFKEKLDTLHILTQVESHIALAEKALAAGVHVYIEKPIAEKASDYSSLIKLAKSKNKFLCTGYSTLGLPAVQKAKDIILSGKFGDLITVHCDFNWSTHGNAIPYGNRDHWAYSLKGGILQNLADHPTSLIVDAMDENHNHSTLFGCRNSLPNDFPDLMHVSTTNDRQIGSYTMSFGHGNTHAQVTYSLEAATVMVDLRRHLLTVIPGRGPQSFPRRIQTGLKLSWAIASGTVGSVISRLTGAMQKDPGIVELIENFYNTIDGNDTFIVSEKKAVQIMILLEQAWEEMKSYQTN